ncbi:unnamed protein product [Effrenium voratum]|nr:unnamed protein product [Effrenium voratum]
MGFVSQDLVLCNRTVRENLFYGCEEEPGEAEAREALRVAQCEETFFNPAAFPKLWHTDVGDSGSDLSGGERQRLALARAVVKKPRLLILDEATSALDEISQAKLQEEVEALRRKEGMTMICVAHRLSNLARADRLLVMQEGRVVEEGTPAALLQSGGVFAEYAQEITSELARPGARLAKGPGTVPAAVWPRAAAGEGSAAKDVRHSPVMPLLNQWLGGFEAEAVKGLEEARAADLARVEGTWQQIAVGSLVTYAREGLPSLTAEAPVTCGGRVLGATPKLNSSGRRHLCGGGELHPSTEVACYSASGENWYSWPAEFREVICMACLFCKGSKVNTEGIDRSQLEGAAKPAARKRQAQQPFNLNSDTDVDEYEAPARRDKSKATPTTISCSDTELEDQLQEVAVAERDTAQMLRDEACELAEGETSPGRYFRIEGHLHLGLNLRLGGTYAEEELQRRCKDDTAKLQRLSDIIAAADGLIREVAPPKKATKEARAEACATAAGEEEALPGPAFLHGPTGVGLLPARVMAITPERDAPFLIRHLDAQSATFKVGSEVAVGGRKAVCIWDGRPEHHFARVRWEDGTESDIIPADEVHLPPECEEVFVSDSDLEPLDLDHLLRKPKPAPEEPAAPALKAPVGVLVRPSAARAELQVGQVAWCQQPQCPPWPAKLISFTDFEACARLWRVKLLGCKAEKLVPGCQLSAFLAGDAAALAGVAQEAEKALLPCWSPELLVPRKTWSRSDAASQGLVAASLGSALWDMGDAVQPERNIIGPDSAIPLLWSSAAVKGLGRRTGRRRSRPMRLAAWLAFLAAFSQVLGSDLEDEDDALIVYEGAGGDAQCTAPPGPVLVKDLVAEIGHDVSEEVIERTLRSLEAEGVVQTRQLLQLFPQDFDAVVMPLLLKSRLRRVRERGGKIPEDLIGHKKHDPEAGGAGRLG